MMGAVAKRKLVVLKDWAWALVIQAIEQAPGDLEKLSGGLSVAGGPSGHEVGR